MDSRLLSEAQVHTIVGKNLVDGTNQMDVSALISHVWALEEILDQLDNDDTFGTEGWRHYFGC